MIGHTGDYEEKAMSREEMKLDAQQALERAERKLAAYVGVCKGDKELTDTVLPMVRAALAALDGKHVYVSDFAVGDETWYIGPDQAGVWRVSASSCKVELRPLTMILSGRLFPTRAEAEAAATERNRKETP